MSTFRMELADAGIRGNGHMMLLEKNNAEGAQKSWLSAETRQRVLVHAVLSPRGSRRASSSCKWRVLPRGIAMASSRASCKTGAGMTRFRTLLAVCFTAMLAAPAWSGRSAGREGDEFAQLRARLRTNDAVRILLGDGSRVDGRVAEVTHQELVVTVDSAPRRLAATDITRVERRRNGVLMGALIGLGAGVPFGAAAGTYAVDATNPPAMAHVNNVTWPTDSNRAGRCRPAVRGFSASNCRSTSRLKAMAALRANTMHNKMPSSGRAPNAVPPSRPQARIAANSANGRANTVWLKRISSSSRRPNCSALAGRQG